MGPIVILVHRKKRFLKGVHVSIRYVFYLVLWRVSPIVVSKREYRILDSDNLDWGSESKIRLIYLRMPKVLLIYEGMW